MKDKFEVAKDALLKISKTQGKVCEDYETCNHVSCRSSYNSWAIADKALRNIFDLERQEIHYQEETEKNKSV